MLEKQNKIIIVDNIPNQLEILGKSFFENGLGCRTFEYDITYDQPLDKVRIAFFDINLTEKVVDPNYEKADEILAQNAPIFNDLGNALNQYISKDNGPYVLIFWTANSKVIDAFKLYMQDERRGFSDTASPILIECIDKTHFIDDEKRSQNLSERILQLLNNQKIKFLFDFEENSRIAGENTLNRIYNILPKTDLWGESDQIFENLDKVLSKIAASALGFEHAKDNPKKALYEGLLPLINYEFLKTESDVNWGEIVNELIAASSYSSLESPDRNIQHQVNALYHIEEFNEHAKDVRGCVIELDKTNDNLLKSLNIDDFQKWFGDLIPIDNKPLRRYLRDSARLIAVEFSAACDYSNRKKRINKYIVGVLIDDFDIGTLINDRKSESSYYLGGCCFQLEESKYNIWLNLNFVFGAKSDDGRLGDPLFILKKEIMDMLGNKYASHVSRIGITSF